MPKLYSPANDEMLDRYQCALEEHFAFLIDEKIHVDIQAVITDGKHALPKGALACIKIVGPEERARGGPDVRILVDFAAYSRLEDVSKEAMYAHELYHIIIAKDKEGETRLDPYHRPVIRLKPDDWYIMGFKEVADWYGAASIERRSFAMLDRALFHQTLFQFLRGEDSLPMGEPEPTVKTRKKGAMA